METLRKLKRFEVRLGRLAHDPVSGRVVTMPVR